MDSINYVNWAGLIYDIVGAFLLGRAVVFNSTKKIAFQVMTMWSYNKDEIGLIVEGKVEAIVGLGLLIAGFVLQGASGVWNENQLAFSIQVVLLAVIVVVHRITLPYFVKKGTEDVVAFIKKRQEKAKFLTNADRT